MKRLFLLLFVMGIVILSPANAKVYYHGVTGIGNSNSDLAYTIEQARTNTGVDTVFIGFGVYKFAAELTIEDVIIGGCSYDGSGGIKRDYPGAVSNNRHRQTILDGNSLVLTMPGDKHRVATVKMGGIIEGCIIRNGHARGTTNNATDMSGFGGGVLIDGGKVHNCIIRGNVAMNMEYSGNNPSKGGGVFITDNGGEVVNCLIVFNLDDKGLGVDGNAGSVVNNTIARNVNAPKYVHITGTNGTPYRHYNASATGSVIPHIELNNFYMATTETTMGQYACFLAAIDLASDYSAVDWTKMCGADTPMDGYTGIAISKYLGMTSAEVSTAPALLNAHTSNTQYIGMSGSAGSGSEVYYPLKAGFVAYNANTDGSTDPSVSNPADPLVRDNFPMAFVSWYGSVAFCAWLGGMLPTEAQWEYAARKKADGSIYSDHSYAGGYAEANSVGWSTSNAGGKAHEVATLLPTELGLYDIDGNVWEWCADWYLTLYPANSSVDPTGTPYSKAYMSTDGGVTGGTVDIPVHNPIYNYSGSFRVRRGGDWSHDVSFFVLGFRSDYYNVYPSASHGSIGFRSVCCANCP